MAEQGKGLVPLTCWNLPILLWVEGSMAATMKPLKVDPETSTWMPWMFWESYVDEEAVKV